MDPSACRVIYIDDRFSTEGWISRDGLGPSAPPHLSASQREVFTQLPPDLQANVSAFLNVFNQVFVCTSGVSFSTKLSELHDQVKVDCTPIIACFDVGSESRHKTLHSEHHHRRAQFNPAAAATELDSPPPSPGLLRRQITFSAESDESYGIPLLSRIASDLQVDDHLQLIIPVAVVQPRRNQSYDAAMEHACAQAQAQAQAHSPADADADTDAAAPITFEDSSDAIDTQMMLQCLDAGALDVVKSPLDKAGIMGLAVHAYRLHKNAKKEQAAFMAVSHRGRKASWVGVEEEKPYAYLREAMVKKLLKGICDPQHVIEDYQHRDIHVDVDRKAVIAQAIGQWGFDGHQFDEDELVYAAVYILKHAVSLPECEPWRQTEDELVRFMQGCRVSYNSFVLYHNFRHAIDVLQSLFYFLVQIGTLPPYPPGSAPPPHSVDKSPIAKLLTHFEALTLLISAIGHDVGHPGVNNMFLVKLNAPLAQLYNDQSVLEAFHCAAYSQILRRHWPAAFNDKTIRKLMISSILATDMGVHSDYMQQLGHLQEKIHESRVTDSWAPKDIDASRVLTCGLLIKCADISNVARPWQVAEKWTYLLQEEFAKQGEMEEAVGIETTLFGGPPELGNLLKLANGQIGFMTIFAHPLFSNVADIIPAMRFAADEIAKNKAVWFGIAEKEKVKQIVGLRSDHGDGGTVSPRTHSPVGHGRKALANEETGTASTVSHAASPLRPNGDSVASGSLDKEDAHASTGTAPRGNDEAAIDSLPTSAVADISVADSSRERASRSRRTSRDMAAVAKSSTLRDSKVTLTSLRGLNGVVEHGGDRSTSTDEQQSTLLASNPAEPMASHNLRDLQQRQERLDGPARESDEVKTVGTGTTSDARRGTTAGELTPTPSTVATSDFTADRSDRAAGDFETKRSRAASAPMRAVSSAETKAYSLSSTHSVVSAEGGQNSEFARSVVNGGDQYQSLRGGRQKIWPVGRKRSRIKMNLAFWKKNKDRDDDCPALPQSPNQQQQPQSPDRQVAD